MCGLSSRPFLPPSTGMFIQETFKMIKLSRNLGLIFLPLGVIQQLRGQNFALRGKFLYSKCGQKKAFFDPLPPHFVHIVIE